jgi:hypothetical protein
MPKGWHIHLFDNARKRIFKVGIADADKAKQKVVEQCSNPSRIVILPLKDGEFEALNLADGQIMESNELN